ncbi:putative extracellular dihydrogeodin oxidase/laccase [Aspergillus uvarum CBS 121591]|uniref:Putative extracellular dihydrogeodin oxidase/laccase n=1 Tax=Aspergillus uvarum CBS 121591 TaxID=1448315 RepID=A0A319CSB2_9EURO|nr:putative extracellular dihydrogeodin oxidase/laccase [Aspergillus uvarum CBS 121591]PYH85727.1 putative extracellular dihydrogeodin oxidase/laccase [Aspergillus uvarum CBS 121591]
MLWVRWLVYSGCAQFGVAARAPQPRDCRNSPTSRNCWKDGFDILTDYTDTTQVPPGKLVEYNLTLSQQVIAPDGYEKLGMVVNGQFPGPAIEADWGDTLRVRVHNNFTLDHNGTGIHWHGIRQLGTNFQDGVPGVTQCPSKPGETQVYEFRITQYGTSWYHGHFSLQYSNGLFGPLIIHGPSSLNWDEDLGPWILHDWYHDDVFSLLWVGEAHNSSRGAIPDTTLLNGRGTFDCNPRNDTRCTGTGGAPFEVTFTRGVKYKFTLINTGNLLEYSFWIDGHNLTIIAMDFVPIEPYVTDVVNLSLGQRYEVVVEANANFTHGSNFRIYAQYCAEVDLLPTTVGIVRYDAEDRQEPWTPPTKQYRDLGCSDPDPSHLVPVVRQSVGHAVNRLEMSDYLRTGQQGWPNPQDFDGGLHKWALGDVPLFINWSDPSLQKLALEPNASFPPETVPIVLDYNTGDWVHFVITNNYTWEDIQYPRNLTPVMHPMHLHGHDFAILAQGSGEFDPSIVPNLENPPRRDVVNVDIGGYAWIAFRIDNPGAWLFHCHIAFHVSSGLGLQFLEQPSKVKPLLEDAGALEGLQDRCRAWSKQYETVNVPDNNTIEDSGV